MAEPPKQPEHAEEEMVGDCENCGQANVIRGRFVAEGGEIDDLPGTFCLSCGMFNKLEDAE